MSRKRSFRYFRWNHSLSVAFIRMRKIGELVIAFTLSMLAISWSRTYCQCFQRHPLIFSPVRDMFRFLLDRQIWQWLTLLFICRVFTFLSWGKWFLSIIRNASEDHEGAFKKFSASLFAHSNWFCLSIQHLWYSQLHINFISIKDKLKTKVTVFIVSWIYSDFYLVCFEKEFILPILY